MILPNFTLLGILCLTCPSTAQESTQVEGLPWREAGVVIAEDLSVPGMDLTKEVRLQMSRNGLVAFQSNRTWFLSDGTTIPLRSPAYPSSTENLRLTPNGSLLVTPEAGILNGISWYAPRDGKAIALTSRKPSSKRIVALGRSEGAYHVASNNHRLVLFTREKRSGGTTRILAGSLDGLKVFWKTGDRLPGHNKLKFGILPSQSLVAVSPNMKWLAVLAPVTGPGILSGTLGIWKRQWHGEWTEVILEEPVSSKQGRRNSRPKPVNFGIIEILDDGSLYAIKDYAWHSVSGGKVTPLEFPDGSQIKISSNWGSNWKNMKYGFLDLGSGQELFVNGADRSLWLAQQGRPIRPLYVDELQTNRIRSICSNSSGDISVLAKPKESLGIWHGAPENLKLLLRVGDQIHLKDGTLRTVRDISFGIFPERVGVSQKKIALLVSFDRKMGEYDAEWFPISINFKP